MIYKSTILCAVLVAVSAAPAMAQHPIRVDPWWKVRYSCDGAPEVTVCQQAPTANDAVSAVVIDAYNNQNSSNDATGMPPMIAYSESTCSIPKYRPDLYSAVPIAHVSHNQWVVRVCTRFSDGCTLTAHYSGATSCEAHCEARRGAQAIAHARGARICCWRFKVIARPCCCVSQRRRPCRQRPCYVRRPRRCCR